MNVVECGILENRLPTSRDGGSSVGTPLEKSLPLRKDTLTNTKRLFMMGSINFPFLIAALR